MNITREVFVLLNQLNLNWIQAQPGLRLELTEESVELSELHPLSGEISNLLKGGACSLPYFTGDKVIWCTLAPTWIQLRKCVSELQAWIIPSYGWQESRDGYMKPDMSGTDFQKAISGISPNNYFRWRSKNGDFNIIVQKLSMKSALENKRPDRVPQRRPSLYELRTRFYTALALGDRSLAEKAINDIDVLELDRAINTQLMRIRLWHTFRDFAQIRNFRYLPSIQSDPNIADSIKKCIKEALGDPWVESTPPQDTTGQITREETKYYWDTWFNLLVDQDDSHGAKEWLEENDHIQLDSLSHEQIDLFCRRWEQLRNSADIIAHCKPLLNEALIIFLSDFIREPEFPRTSFAELYLILMRIWGDLNKGVGTPKEAGHILLELADALFELNYHIDEVKNCLEDWWRARPAVSQLPFAIDAIELIAYKHPDNDAAGNLWIEAGDYARRVSHSLLDSEKAIWRTVGLQIGLDEATINEYFPSETKGAPPDILAGTDIKDISIICMREQQAQLAAETIKSRTKARVSIVTSMVRGPETEKARLSDVIMFVWTATTHAVFRALDGVDRKKLCYVQGTGAASIVRTLERWVKERSN